MILKQKWGRKKSRFRASLVKKPFSLIFFFKFAPGLLVSFIIFSSFFLLLRSDILKIKRADVFFEGQGYFTQEISDFIRRETLGRNLLLINLKGVRSGVEKKFRSIKSVTIKKILPNRLSVYVYSRDPLAIIGSIEEDLSATSSALLRPGFETSSSSEVYLIDEEGVIFFKGTSLNLPWYITGPDRVELGEVLNRPVERFIVDSIIKMRDYEIPLETIREKDGEVIGVLRDGSFVLLNPVKEAVYQVNLVKMLLEKYKIEAKNIAKFDLRFKNPVVEFR